MTDEKKLPDEALNTVSGGQIVFTSEEEARQAWENFQQFLRTKNNTDPDPEP